MQTLKYGTGSPVDQNKTNVIVNVNVKEYNRQTQDELIIVYIAKAS